MRSDEAGGGDLDPGAVGRQVRRRRRAVGLTQDELAARAGVSRQSVGALESGQHLPRVDAALRLSRVLGTTVDDLLAAGTPRAVHVLGEALRDGEPVRAAQVGDHTVVVPLTATVGGEAFAAPDAVVRDSRVEVLADAALDGFVVVGCDPALGILAALAPSRGGGNLLPVMASSAAALDALTTGRAHAAVVHGASPPTPVDGARVHRLSLATWRTGLAAPVGRGGDIAEALAGRGTLIQRDPGASAQVAYERALTEVGVTAVPSGPRARGHLDAARRARELGVPAVTIEPVAEALGLSFHALETHRVEVWIASDAADHPGARQLGELLASARLGRHLAVLPGYELAGSP